MQPDKSSRHPFQVPDTGDFRCGRCGTLLDGGTDEPVEARELRKALDQAEARIAMLRAEIRNES